MIAVRLNTFVAVAAGLALSACGHQKPIDPSVFLDQTDEAISAGRYEAAGKQFGDCLEAEAHRTGACPVDGIPDRLQYISEEYPQGLAVMRRARDTLERRILQTDESANFSLYTDINEALGEEKRSVATYDGIPVGEKGEPTRNKLFQYIVSALTREGRYALVVSHALNLLESFNVIIYERYVTAAFPDSGVPYIEFAPEPLLCLYEALLRVNKPRAAEELANMLIALVPESREKLKAIADNVGAGEESRGLSQVPTD